MAVCGKCAQHTGAERAYGLGTSSDLGIFLCLFQDSLILEGI